VIDRLTGVLSELSDIEKKLACAAGVSSDPSCAGLRPTRGLVEPLSARGEQARRTLAAVPADPVFPVLDVAKLAGAP
ncbi:MAG TPA: hypothetical protein VEB22_08635, partial [Phycisphaerales bacterium]|nr:hypothetical protein [Phycisphaerales bacterium]